MAKWRVAVGSAQPTVAVSRQEWRQLLRAEHVGDAVQVFIGFPGLDTVQRVAAAARMRVVVAERRWLGLQRFQQRQQHRVLEYIGEIAGVVGVAIVHGRDGLRNCGLYAAEQARWPASA